MHYVLLTSSHILTDSANGCLLDGIVSSHYENTPMPYTEIFSPVKIENFQCKIFDIFLIFAQNIDCGYTLEPPRRF